MAKFRLAPGATSLSVAGQEYLPDEEGCVVIDDVLRPDAERAGCTFVGDEQPPPPPPPAPSGDALALQKALEEIERLKGEGEKAAAELKTATDRVAELEAEVATLKKAAKAK